MRLHHLENEEVVLVDQRILMQLAFKTRMAFADQGCSDLVSLLETLSDPVSATK